MSFFSARVGRPRLTSMQLGADHADTVYSHLYFRGLLRVAPYSRSVVPKQEKNFSLARNVKLLGETFPHFRVYK